MRSFFSFFLHVYYKVTRYISKTNKQPTNQTNQKEEEKKKKAPPTTTRERLLIILIINGYCIHNNHDH